MDISYIENQLDYETYFRLRECVGWNNFSEQQAREAISRSAYTVTAQSMGETVGMARLLGDGMYYIIADVIVMPAHQGKGLGTALMRMLLAYVEQSLCENARASIQLIAEQGKEAFYETLGFKRIPHEFCGSGMRKVLYGRKSPARHSNCPQSIVEKPKRS